MPKRYMKRDVESLLSVSKAVMSTSTTLNKSPELTFDTRDDESTSTTFDVLDDSFPIHRGRGPYGHFQLEELS